MKDIKKLLVFSLLMVLFMSCGSNRSTSKKSRQQEEVTKEQYLYTQSDLIFDKYKKNNQGQVNSFTVAYIGNYKDIAIDKMVNYKIPASITLAQGILESGNGLSTLAKKSNNHFGIKCHSGWKGKKVYHDDDKRGECFRKYDNPEGSFNDHSKFLTGRGRYEFLFDLEPDDYKGWAKGLKKAGYATDRKYPKKLIAFIENFELYKYDELVLDEKGYKRAKKEMPLANNDGAETFIIVSKGDTLYSISRNNNIALEELKRLNGLNSNAISIGQKLIVSE
jgi:flagellum-specific peptidoglycan hydrolase FlgJ